MKAQELAGFGGGFMDALQARARMALFLQLMLKPTDDMPEAIGKMLIGMGLFRLGFFTLGWSNRAYLATDRLRLSRLRADHRMARLSDLEEQLRSAGHPPIGGWQQATRPFIALAHASVLLLIVRSGAVRWLMDRFAAAGRMAFSNYLMTSIITTFVFCGFGFGLYGKLSRFELLYVVVGVWAFILVWSKPWLARFHYGPFEWAWRSLVRWEPQPFVKRGPKAAGATA